MHEHELVAAYAAVNGRLPKIEREMRPVTVARKWWQFWRPKAWTEQRTFLLIRNKFTTMVVEEA